MSKRIMNEVIYINQKTLKLRFTIKILIQYTLKEIELMNLIMNIKSVSVDNLFERILDNSIMILMKSMMNIFIIQSSIERRCINII